MLKKVSLAAIAALSLVTASSAMADDFLETTGNRNAPAYSAPATQQRGFAPLREFRLEQRGFVAPSQGQTGLENSARDKAISTLGQG